MKPTIIPLKFFSLALMKSIEANQIFQGSKSPARLARKKCAKIDRKVAFKCIQGILGGGFKHFLFSLLPGEMIQFDYFFLMG